LRPWDFSVIAGVDPSSVESVHYVRQEYGFHVRDGAAQAILRREAGFDVVEV